MSEGIGASSKGEGAGPEAGGMPVAAAPTAKKFFLLEYFDEVRRGFKWMRTSPRPEKTIVTKVQGGLINWSKLRKARVGIVVVLLIAGAAYGVFSVQAGTTDTVDKPGGGVPPPPGTSYNNTITGHVSENGNTSSSTANLPAKLATFKIVLTWTDEPVGFALTNQPDQLGLVLTAPNGMNFTVAPTATSPVTWNLPDPAANYGAGAWTIDITGGTMGDVTRAGGIGPCPRCSSDTGNDFSAQVDATW